MAQQTKNAIRRAFIQLLNERPLDKISIKDIAEKGAVNRNTFYYYYADIYALVEDILQLEIQDFQSKLRRYDSWQEAVPGTLRPLPPRTSGPCIISTIRAIRKRFGATTIK